MHTFILSIVFAFTAHAQYTAMLAIPSAKQQLDSAVPSIASKLIERAFEVWTHQHRTLENTTLLKDATSPNPWSRLSSTQRFVNHIQRPLGIRRHPARFHGTAPFPFSSIGARVHVCMAAGPGRGAGSFAGGGGDLSGGGDQKRNAQLETLRNMFTAPAAQDVPEAELVATPGVAKRNVRRLGMLLDLPLCRFSWCILPHHQVTLNIWQPQYTLMFSKLLAQPGPHYYLHVLLPGGAESLGQPDYELVPGSKASLMGTLMRVVYAERREDSKLTLVVQGLARGVVLRATQELPYSRGDVQILPDSEALLAGARAAEHHLRQCLPAGGAAIDGTNLSSSGSNTSDSVKRRLVAAAAAAESETFFQYEAARLSVDSAGNIAPLNQFNESSAEAAICGVAGAVEAALRETPVSALEPVDPYNGSCVLTALQAALTGTHTEGVVENYTPTELHELSAVGSLEVQVWLELDDLLQALSKHTAAAPGSVPIPSQILGLLPPAPHPTGWPKTFELKVIEAMLQSQYRQQRVTGFSNGSVSLTGDAVRAISYVPADPRYPPRKRAERLSWVIWAVIGDQQIGVNAFGGSPFQAILEADGTAERLRLALVRLRDLKRQVEMKS